jgi:hypothetical protein
MFDKLLIINQKGFYTDLSRYHREGSLSTPQSYVLRISKWVFFKELLIFNKKKVVPIRQDDFFY